MHAYSSILKDIETCNVYEETKMSKMQDGQNKRGELKKLLFSWGRKTENEKHSVAF